MEFSVPLLKAFRILSEVRKTEIPKDFIEGLKFLFFSTEENHFSREEEAEVLDFLLSTPDFNPNQRIPDRGRDRSPKGFPSERGKEKGFPDLPLIAWIVKYRGNPRLVERLFEARADICCSHREVCFLSLHIPLTFIFFLFLFVFSHTLVFLFPLLVSTGKVFISCSPTAHRGSPLAASCNLEFRIPWGRFGDHRSEWMPRIP